MRKLLAIHLACLTVALPMAAFSAQGEYWEITSKTEMAGVPYAMPANTVKVCIAKGAERDPRQAAPNKDCEVTDVKNVGNKTSWKMRCTQNGETMTGTGEVSGTPDKSEGVIHLNGKSGGTAINMTQTYTSKRLGGSCEAK